MPFRYKERLSVGVGVWPSANTRFTPFAVPAGVSPSTNAALTKTVLPVPHEPLVPSTCTQSDSFPETEPMLPEASNIAVRDAVTIALLVGRAARSFIRFVTFASEIGSEMDPPPGPPPEPGGVDTRTSLTVTAV